ncbi:MAG: SUMF1/EgtB/PvdO family nonheme iron enzyme, partial [Nitrospirae bacterium]|nr:SUMF1/EgtB/PvdO family nonheme iron enzyme [Nitrospirota bacterium]
MMQSRNMIPATMFGLLSVLWITSDLSLANETPLAKPEPVPAPAQVPAPAPPKPHVAESEPKPPGKVHPPSPAGAISKPVGQPQLPVEITGKDGVPMMLVPAGEFTMGSDKGDDDEQPIHRAFLDSFYMDKFEVTNGRFAKFVEAIQSEPPWGFADKETPVVHS